jgi:di/tricarboxylate transporter
MTNDQLIIFAVLFATMTMFLWGRWRHDQVALGALLVCVFTGQVPGNEAFAGFGHPAVITVACVLVLGYGLFSSGAVDLLARRFIPGTAGKSMSIITLITLAAVLSAFMNNVGALALLMPLSIQMAAKLDIPPGKILMPLAFGSILGGMTTLIGTPPNLIVSEYRAGIAEQNFGMFDFTPVGISVAVFGLLFIGLTGWRLVPARPQTEAGSFDSARYLSEVRIIKGSKAIDKRLREVEKMLDKAGAQIISMIRHDVHIAAPNPWRVLEEGDILVIEVEPEFLSTALTEIGLKLEDDLIAPVNDKEPGDSEVEPLTAETGTVETAADSDRKQQNNSGELVIQELVVKPNAILIDRSASAIDLRSRYGISLLAISREGRRSIQRLRSLPIKAGDVLLMQGTPEAIAGFASLFGCLPLAPRDIRVPKKGQALSAILIMAVTVIAAAMGVLPVAVLFASAMFAFIALGIVPLRSVYTTIDWPVIVLIAAMLPVAGAVASTGTADTIAHFLLDNITHGHAIGGLITLLVVTMFLSDLVNNAATAAVMCPIAISTANQLGVNTDAFLMAVAVGASCAFLTPIGHQNNTLILGPGGFQFGDYWRLGLLLEIIVVAVSVPVILWVWPL